MPGAGQAQIWKAKANDESFNLEADVLTGSYDIISVCGTKIDCVYEYERESYQHKGEAALP